MLFLRRSWFLTVTLLLLVGSGCSDTAREATTTTSSAHSHSHDEHDPCPQSLKDAIVELTTLRNTIRDFFEENDPKAAHGPLHDVGELLVSIPNLSTQENVGAEQQAVIETLVNTLLDAFGRVDKTMHGQEGSTYAEESATIDTALSALVAACNPGTASTENPAVLAEGRPPAAAQEPATIVREKGVEGNEKDSN